VYATIETSLYTYERPIGALLVTGYVGLGYRDETGKPQQITAHRLIWTVCRGPIPDGYVINHLNGNKIDNRISNLEAVTQAQNLQHAYDTGLIPSGEDHYSSKLTDLDVTKVRRMLADGMKQGEIAAIFNVSGPLISNVNTGRGRYARTG